MSTNIVYRPRQLASTKDRPGLLPVGQATIWRWVRAGKFPRPFTMGVRCTVWEKGAVDAWISRSKATGLPTADTTAKIETPAATAKGPHRKVVSLHASAGEGVAQ